MKKKIDVRKNRVVFSTGKPILGEWLTIFKEYY